MHSRLVRSANTRPHVWDLEMANQLRPSRTLSHPLSSSSSSLSPSFASSFFAVAAAAALISALRPSTMSMDSGAKKILESVTIKTLHAHNFSRSSTQANQYAQHAGRLRLSVHDAVHAMDELGTSVEELKAKEMARYAVHSSKRLEDLNELKAQLAIGLRPDLDDRVPLEWGPVPDDLPSEEEEESDFDEVETPDEDHVHADVKMVDLHREEDPDVAMSEAHLLEPKDLLTRSLPTPPLPLSPVSNPSTPPPRKRQRTAHWQPPEYIPDFLPPFPTDEPRRSPSPPPIPTDPTAVNPVKMERPNTPPLQQAEAAAATTTSSANPSADYLTQIPYEESSLSKLPAWHLPQPPPPDAGPSDRSSMPLPQTQPALLGAYHHILTHPPPPRVSSVNPARYRAALAFLAESEAIPRWDAPTTLYSATAPNPPRVAPMPPFYAVPIGKSGAGGTPDGGKEKEEEKRPNPPGAPPRSIVPSERLTPTVSQPGSRLPKLARQVLSAPVYARTTRVQHPPVLQRGSQKLTYGPGVNAPWNASFSPMPAATPAPGKGKDGAAPPGSANGLANGKEKEKEPPRPLPDARLYATWSYEQKAFDEPLVVRRRVGSIAVPPPAAGRAKSEAAGLRPHRRRPPPPQRALVRRRDPLHVLDPLPIPRDDEPVVQRLELGERQQRRHRVVRHLRGAEHAHERPWRVQRGLRRAQRGPRRRVLDRVRRVELDEGAHELERVARLSVPAHPYHARVSDRSANTLRRRETTHSESTLIMAAYARSTIRALTPCTADRPALHASSTGLHSSQTSRANRSAIFRSNPRGAFAARSSASTYVYPFFSTASCLKSTLYSRAHSSNGACA
ncbi:hypothetical protein ACG7TL_007637 [Trametes sanguinea]